MITTLTQFITDVRDHGDYHRSTKITDAMITGFINSAISEAWDLLCESWADYLTVETTLTADSGVSTVLLPLDFYKLVRLDVLFGTTYRRVRSFNVSEEVDVERVGSAPGRFRYRLQSGDLILKPVPAQDETLRLVYIPESPTLEDSADEFDSMGVNQLPEYIVHLALYHCAIREERPTAEVEREIDRMRVQIERAAAPRDAGEAYVLPDNDVNWEDW
jgi:hypothetical protein